MWLSTIKTQVNSKLQTLIPIELSAPCSTGIVEQHIDSVIKDVLWENQLEHVMPCLVLVNLMRCQSVSSSCDWFLHLFLQLFCFTSHIGKTSTCIFSSGEYQFYSHLKFDPKITLKYSSSTIYNNQLFYSRAGYCTIKLRYTLNSHNSNQKHDTPFLISFHSCENSEATGTFSLSPLSEV